MRIGLRILLGYFLIVALAALLLGQVFLREVKPGVRQAMEDTLVDTANVLAELATDDFLAGRMDDGRFATRVRALAGRDIGDLPAVGLAPEWMSERALSIGTYFVASGVYVIFGTKNPVAGSEEVLSLISEGWEAKVGGKLEFILDPEEMVQKTLEHIDKKRAELGLAEYDPTRFGESGDTPLAEFFAVPPEERNLYSRKAYTQAAAE